MATRRWDEVNDAPQEPRSLALLSQARTALARVTKLDDVKDIRDRAEAIRCYVKQQGEGIVIQNQAADLKIRAERRAGELLAAMEMRGGDRKSGSKLHDATLKDLGIEKTQSHRWQAMAAVPEGVFEAHVADVVASNKELTSSGVYVLSRNLKNGARNATVVASDTRALGELDTLLAEGRKFGTVYADPPWRYGNQATRAATDNHYPTMTPAEIAALPIADIVAETAHLHLWTTNAFLFDCPDIMRAWGFEYRGVFVWVKPQMGIGNYWRVSHEFLVLGVRGPGATFRDRSLKSWLESNRGQHSAKPEAVRAMIERASPGPRLELFGRRTAPGWTVWGNQIERNMFDHDAREVGHQRVS